MKLKKLIIAGILSLSLLGFAGCEADDGAVDDETPVEDETIEDPDFEGDEDDDEADD
jgi:hypothetical protein